MSLPMVAANVFGVFAITGIVICWGFVATALLHLKKRVSPPMPFIMATIGAVRCVRQGGSWLDAAVVFVAVYVATAMTLTYLYGWMRGRALEENEQREGAGRFRPVMLVWTGCIVFVVLIALLNLAVTGTMLPSKVAGF